MPYTPANNNIAELLRRRGDIEAQAEYNRGNTAATYAQIAGNSIQQLLQYKADEPRRQALEAETAERKAQNEERARERLGTQAEREAMGLLDRKPSPVTAPTDGPDFQIPESLDPNLRSPADQSYNDPTDANRQQAYDYLKERGFGDRAAAMKERLQKGDEDRLDVFDKHLAKASSATAKAAQIAAQIDADPRLFNHGMGVIQDIAKSLNHPELADQLPKTYDPATFKEFMGKVSDLAGQFEKQQADQALVKIGLDRTVEQLTADKAIDGYLHSQFSDVKDQAGWDAAAQLAKAKGIPDDRIAAMGGFDGGKGPQRALEQQLTPKERHDLISGTYEIKGNQDPVYNTWVSLVHQAQADAARDGKPFTKPDADKLWEEALKKGRGPEKPGSWEEQVQKIEKAKGRPLTRDEMLKERRDWALADDAARRAAAGADDPLWARDRALYEDMEKRHAEAMRVWGEDKTQPMPPPIPEFRRWRWDTLRRGEKLPPLPEEPKTKTQPDPDLSGAAAYDRLMEKQRQEKMADVNAKGLDFTGRPLQAPPPTPPPLPPGAPPPDTRTVEQRMGMPASGDQPPVPPRPPSIVPEPAAGGPPPMPQVVHDKVVEVLTQHGQRPTEQRVVLFMSDPSNRQRILEELGIKDPGAAPAPPMGGGRRPFAPPSPPTLGVRPPGRR